MADTTVKAVIEVQAKTDQASRAMKELGNAIAETGAKSRSTGQSIVDFGKGVVDGLGKFNQAFEGAKKIYEGLNKAMDIALDQQRQVQMEKLLPAGTVDKYRQSVENLITRQDVLRLSVKGLTGDFKLTNSQMETVLKTSIALQQKGFGPAAENAEKLLDALAKGVNKLDDFGINLEKTNDRQADVNAAMAKFRDIIAENPVDAQTKSLMQMKDAIHELTVALSELIAAMARWGANAFRYTREGVNYARDIYDRWFGDQFEDNPEFKPGMTAIERMQARQDRRDTLFGYRAGQQLLGRARGAIKTGREDQAYWQGLSEEEYARTYGIETGEGFRNLVDRYGTIGHKAKKGGTTDYAYLAEASRRDPLYRARFNAGYEGDLGGYASSGVGGVNPLAVVVMGIGAPGKGLNVFEMAAVGAKGDLLTRQQYEALATRGATGLNQLRYGGQSFGPGSAESEALLGQSRGGYDPSNPLASFSAMAGEKVGFGAQGAFDAGTAGMLAGIDALVSGQEAVGKSIAKASATALKAKAVEWGAFAIGELAWGIAESAVFSPTAAGHFAAAAKFGVAAAAAGLGASALGSLAGGGGGGGAGNYGAAGGGYASPTGGGPSKGGGGDTFVINLGDGFYGDHAALADAVANGVRQGKRRGARSDDYSVNYSG
jgi:hypothetical protein